VCAEDQRRNSRAGRTARERQIRSEDRSEDVLRRLELPNRLAAFDNDDRDRRD